MVSLKILLILILCFYHIFLTKAKNYQNIAEILIKEGAKVEKNVGGIEGLFVITPAVHGDRRA